MLKKALVLLAVMAALSPHLSQADTTATPPFADESHDSSAQAGSFGLGGNDAHAASDADLDGSVNASADASSSRLQGLAGTAYADAFATVISPTISIPPEGGTMVVTATIHIDQSAAARESSTLQQLLGEGQVVVLARAGLVFDAWFGEDFVMANETVFDSAYDTFGTITDEDVIVHARFDPSWTDYARENPARLAAGVSLYVTTGRGQGSVSASIDAHVESISIAFE